MKYIALSLILPATTVHAQPRCAPRDNVIAKLQNDYGETRRSIGLAKNNSLVEVHASGTSGTWSITVTTPNGTTCLVAAGNSFEALTANVEGDPT